MKIPFSWSSSIGICWLNLRFIDARFCWLPPATHTLVTIDNENIIWEQPAPPPDLQKTQPWQRNESSRYLGRQQVRRFCKGNTLILRNRCLLLLQLAGASLYVKYTLTVYECIFYFLACPTFQNLLKRSENTHSLKVCLVDFSPTHVPHPVVMHTRRSRRGQSSSSFMTIGVTPSKSQYPVP